MPRLPTLCNALAAITMAVAALCGGGKAVAEQKGTLSIIRIEPREEFFERHLDGLATDIRRALREAGNIRRGRPVVTRESVTIKIRRAEDYDRALEALSVVAPTEYYTIEGDPSSRQLVFSVTKAFREDAFRNAFERVARFVKTRLFSSDGDLLLRPLPNSKIAIWQSDDTSLRYHPHGIQVRRLLLSAVVDGFAQDDLKKGQKISGTTIVEDAHHPERLWLISSTPLFHSGDILSVEHRLSGSIPQIEVSFRRSISSHYGIHLAKGSIALVVDDKVFSTNGLIEQESLSSLNSLSFHSGLSPEETQRLAAETDPIGAQVKLVLVEQCERSRLRSLRNMSC